MIDYKIAISANDIRKTNSSSRDGIKSFGKEYRKI